VADEMELPGWMRLREGMDLYASYFSQWRQSVADELLKRFTLDPAWKFGGLNKGHKRRFFLMLAIAQQPDLIVLDEPAGGLDPLVRNEFLDLLLEVGRERNVTILISSHILSDVERIIDEVAFIRDGRRLLQANLEDLKTRVKRIWVPNGELPRVKERFNVIAEEAKSNGWLVAVDDFDATQLDGLESDLQHLNLEDLFMFYNETAAVEETGA
jgi:ABC-2 type transport system ATP-binding protein